MDESWDLTTYSLEIQCGYERLIGLGLGVDYLHDAPYSGNVEEAVYRGLHRYLTELPRFFLSLVDNAVAHFDHSAERKGKARGGVSGMIKFKLFLEKQLDLHEAQELLWNSTGSFGNTQLPKSTAPTEREGIDVGEQDVVMDEGGDSDPPIASPGPTRARTAHGTPAHSPRNVRTVHSPPPSSLLNKLRAVHPHHLPRATNILPRRSSSSASTDSHQSFATALSSEPDLVETPLTSLDEAALNPLGPVDNLGENMGILSRNIARQEMPIPAVPADQRVVYVTRQTSYEPMVNKLDIKFDILWRFERALSSWDDVTTGDLAKLQGCIVDVASRLQEVVRQIASRKSGSSVAAEKAIWSITASEREVRLLNEADREEESIRSGDMRGLGLQPHDDWLYGGKIQYSIVIRPKAGLPHRDFRRVKSAPLPLATPQPSRPSDAPYRMELQPPRMSGKSFRLARRFGSRRVITFRIHNDVKDKASVMTYFRGRIFVILGRPYRALWSPPDSDNIMAIETSDEISPIPVTRIDPPMPSFLEMLAMFNDLSAKPGQAVAKWAARPQLLFSDSVPAAVVDPAAIGYLDDIVTAEAQLSGKASTEQTLTDGCGLMSDRLAGRIFSHPALRFESGRPCVLQVRIGGAKGLLALMSTEQQALHPNKDILIRPSMLKALPASPHANDPSHCVVDVVRSDVLKLGTMLSAEPIIVMVDRGVPVETIVALGMQSLDELRDAFSPLPLPGETGDDVLRRIHAACYRQGGVGTERKKRKLALAGKSTKVAGLTWESTTSEISESGVDGDGVELLSSAERYEVDPISGQPGSMAEALMEAIAGGFNPLDSFYTCNKLHHTMRLQLDASRKLKFRVESSLSAFIVPDSLGVLAPDEIFIRFSKEFPLDPITKCPMTHLTGDVLVFRSPCKLPSDVRKFRAVYRPELAHLSDCVVMSAHPSCSRSPASFLGGGDYDGDTVQVFWDKALVEPFQNAPDAIADTPEGFEERYFEKDTLSGADFLQAMEGQDVESQIASMQHFLLGALLDERNTGVYSKLHANAVYTRGLADPQTMDLARVFCAVLDARKSGLRLRDEVRRQHMREYEGFLDWLALRKGEENINQRTVARPRHLGPFVMDLLKQEAEKKSVEIMGEFLSDVVDDRRSEADYEALSKPWTTIEAVAASQTGIVHIDLAKIRKHVSVCYEIAHAIRNARVDRYQSIDKLYTDLLSNGNSPPDTPNGASTPVHPGMRYRRNASPIKRKKKSEEDENSIIVVTQMRRLAEVWRDRMTPSDVPTCCWGDEAMLARLKVGYGATLAKPRSRQKFTFDMDFHTTRILKSETLGGKLGVIPAIYESLKPGWKADLEE